MSDQQAEVEIVAGRARIVRLVAGLLAMLHRKQHNGRYVKHCRIAAPCQ